MRHGDSRYIFTLAKHVSGFFPYRLGGSRTGSGGSRPASLHPGIHIGAIVIADIEDVVVTFEHPRQAAHPDIHGAAIASLGNHPGFLAFGAKRCRRPRSYCGSIAE